jgi:hypothetical protein
VGAGVLSGATTASEPKFQSVMVAAWAALHAARIAAARATLVCGGNVSTTYDDITKDTNSTGIANLQVQYNTNVNNVNGWTNVGSLLNATVGNSSTGGSFQTDTINFRALGITGVNNDATFGVRLVSAYNPTLGTYASASSGIAGSPGDYNNNSGNWRFADVQIDGTVAPVPLPAAAGLLVSGLGGLGTLVRKRKTASPSAGDVSRPPDGKSLSRR